MLTCDHASRELKGIKPLDNENGRVRTSEGFDPGAAEFVNALSERLNCIAILTNFSKLIIDSSVPICNQDLIPTFFKE